jgi:hypothetical protein
MDHWSFPVGTRLWKELADERGPIETRLAERWGAGVDEWNYVAYGWRPDGSDADIAVDGVEDALGSGHDIPAAKQCDHCHGKLPERVLGLSALQVAGREGALGDMLTQAPPDAGIPGDEIERAALGYLHANCGNCHNDSPDAVRVSMQLRLHVGERTVQATSIYRTTVGQPTEVYDGSAVRVLPGDPEGSAVWLRQSARGVVDQMPPLGSERVDDHGAAVLAAWIESLAR